MMQNQIIQGDCLEVMKDMPDNSVDLVLTDPPYGINKAEWDKEVPQGYIPECLRIAACICVMPGIWALPECVAEMNGNYKGIIAGHNKNGMTYSPLGYGNWIPAVVAGKRPKSGQDAFDFCVAGDKPSHPSPKPIEFMLWLVDRLSLPNDLILDPFCGSGTTCVAAKMLGRNYIGIDISEKYCEIARKRIAAAEKSITVKELEKGQKVLF